MIKYRIGNEVILIGEVADKTVTSSDGITTCSVVMNGVEYNKEMEVDENISYNIPYRDFLDKEAKLVKKGEKINNLPLANKQVIITAKIQADGTYIGRSIEYLNNGKVIKISDKTVVIGRVVKIEKNNQNTGCRATVMITMYNPKEKEAKSTAIFVNIKNPLAEAAEEQLKVVDDGDKKNYKMGLFVCDSELKQLDNAYSCFSKEFITLA